MSGATLLWRQVNPHWVRAGRVTSQVFKPTRKDERRLSVDDGDLVSAEQAYRAYTENYPSAGVLAVSLDECRAQELAVSPDPLAGRPAHAVIDFGGLSRSRVRVAAEHLRDGAQDRGWQYPDGAPVGSPPERPAFP